METPELPFSHLNVNSCAEELFLPVGALLLSGCVFITIVVQDQLDGCTEESQIQYVVDKGYLHYVDWHKSKQMISLVVTFVVASLTNLCFIQDTNSLLQDIDLKSYLLLVVVIGSVFDFHDLHGLSL